MITVCASQEPAILSASRLLTMLLLLPPAMLYICVGLLVSLSGCEHDITKKVRDELLYNFQNGQKLGKVPI